MKIVIDKESIIKMFAVVLYATSGGESSEDYINAKNAVRELLEKIDHEPYEERPQGEWLNVAKLTCQEYDGRKYGECSICHKVRQVENFCPHCGANMRGGRE